MFMLNDWMESRKDRATTEELKSPTNQDKHPA